MSSEGFIDYFDGDQLLRGYYAGSEVNLKRPVVLIFSDYFGRGEFSKERALMLSRMGYIGFAVDMYGTEQFAKDTDEASLFMEPFMEDRSFMVKRGKAALRAIEKIPHADLTQVAAIGFCFGGLCALDLARSGADLKGVIGFHTLLKPQKIQSEIHAKVLILMGKDDPFETEQEIKTFQREMTLAMVDWQMHFYGNVMHAFTNPNACDKEKGTVYDDIAARRAYLAMQNFLHEIFH